MGTYRLLLLHLHSRNPALEIASLLECVQQGDALRATPDIAVHPVAPNVKFGAGGGIGPLSVDHQLVCKGVLVQPGCGGQVVRPAFPIPGQAVRRALGKVKVFLRFVWHFGLLSALW